MVRIINRAASRPEPSGIVGELVGLRPHPIGRLQLPVLHAVRIFNQRGQGRLQFIRRPLYAEPRIADVRDRLLPLCFTNTTSIRPECYTTSLIRISHCTLVYFC